MRVLYWADLFWPYIGGAEVFSCSLIPAMRERGHEFTVLTSHDYLDLPDEACHEGIPIRRLPFRKALSGGDIDLLFRTRQQVAEIKRALKPDLVHIDGVGPSALFHLDTATTHPAPVLVTMNQEVLCGGASAQEALTGKVLRAADWIACVSAAVRDQVRQQVPEATSRSSTIHYGLHVPALSPRPLPGGAPRLLCLGRLVPAKGFDLALEAIASLLVRYPGLRLTVAGDGSERQALERQADALGIRQSVDFVGWVEPSGVPALLNTATAVLMPSRREGLPLVGIQAALMARPIVAARAGGLPEIVVHGQTGLLVEKEDSRALAAAIAFLLDRPEVAARMGQAARHRAREIFGWQRCVAAYSTLYQTLSRRGTDARYSKSPQAQ